MDANQSELGLKVFHAPWQRHKGLRDNKCVLASLDEVPQVCPSLGEGDSLLRLAKSAGTDGNDQGVGSRPLPLQEVGVVWGSAINLL